MSFTFSINNVEKLYRLSASNIIRLQKQLAIKLRKEGFKVSGHKLILEKTKSSVGQQVIYYIFQKKINDELVTIMLLPPCKDSKQLENEKTLPFIDDVLFKLMYKYDLIKMILLIPLRQCRRHLHLPATKKEHIILVEFNFPNGQLISHDSKKDYVLNKITEIYPDRIKILHEILLKRGFKLSYKKNFYGQQDDDVTCGFFNHEYFSSFIRNGNSNAFDKIKCVLGSPLKKSNHDLSINYVYVGANKGEYIERFDPNYGKDLPYSGEDEIINQKEDSTLLRQDDLSEEQFIALFQISDEDIENAAQKNLIDFFQKHFQDPVDKSSHSNFSLPMNLFSFVQLKDDYLGEEKLLEELSTMKINNH